MAQPSPILYTEICAAAAAAAAAAPPPLQALEVLEGMLEGLDVRDDMAVLLDQVGF